MDDGNDYQATAPSDSVTPHDQSIAAVAAAAMMGAGTAAGVGKSIELTDANADVDTSSPPGTKSTAPPPAPEALNVFRLSMTEAFKTGLTPRKAKLKDAGGNHERGGKLWAGCMEGVAVVSTIAIVWTFLKRCAGDFFHEGGGGSKERGESHGKPVRGEGRESNRPKAKDGYTLVVKSGSGSGSGKDGADVKQLQTSTRSSAPKPPSARVKAGKNMFGTSSGKKH
jgi:hypothetical protein